LDQYFSDFRITPGWARMRFEASVAKLLTSRELIAVNACPVLGR
jgi:hypothetical protein